MSNFAFKKPTFWSKQEFWESNEKQDGAYFTLQEGVIEDRMKQERYTQGRMAERSKAPDSRNSPLRLLVHEYVPGFECHSCQILRSKSQHFGRSRSSESQMRSKTNGFHVTRRCYRSQDEASAIYSRQDGRAVYGARLKKFSFETSGTRMCAWVRSPLLSNFAFEKATL